MKKNLLVFITIIWCLFLTTTQTKAVIDTKTPIRFIYINGSNSNTEKDKLTFISGMNKLHTSVKKDFETNDFIQKNLLDNGNLYIANKPKIFFWGYSSSNALSSVKEDLLTIDMISPKMAQTVRKIITGVMHDAIWVQKESNMQAIVNNLHKDIMNSHEKGEKIVLFGHSAGSFITYRYLFYKLPAIPTDEMLIYIEKSNNISSIDKKYPVKSTCIDAITASGIGVYSANGEFVINQNPIKLRENFLKLNDYTKTQCIPDKEVLGIVNFGSPVALFYSSDKNSPSENINRYNMNLYRYLKDNNIFFLTVNFTDDPIGFPLSKNLSSEEIENIYNIGFNTTGRGFFYSKSDVRSPATFVGAHYSYWKYTDKFARAVTTAYIEGYKNFYPDL